MGSKDRKWKSSSADRSDRPRAARAIAQPASGSSGFAGQFVLSALLIGLLTLIAYSNTFSIPWHFDDEHAIQTNKEIRDLQGCLSRIGSSTRSLVMATFAINYAIGGLDPRGYHVVNLCIHGLASICLFGWLHRILGTDRRYIAFFAAALFAVHPLATQSVTYVTQRLSSMAGLFFFLALWMWAVFRTTSGRRSNLAYVACLIAALAGMFCKEMALAIPLALVVADLSLHWRGPALMEAELNSARPKRLPFSNILAWTLPILLIPAFLIRTGFISMGRNPENVAVTLNLNEDAQAANVTRAVYFFSEWRVLVEWYLQRMLIPMNLSISPPFTAVSGPTDAPTVISGVILVSMLLLGTWLAFRPGPIERRLAGFGLLLFFLGLGITSTFIPTTEFIQEQRAYASLAGVVTAVVIGISALPFLRRARCAVLGLIVVVFAGMTYARNQIWRDRLALWQSAADLWEASGFNQPMAARTYTNLGVWLRDAGRLPEAEARHRQALKADPNYPLAHINLGNLLSMTGRNEDSLSHFDAALRVKPNHHIALNSKGTALARMGRVNEAKPLFEKAVAISPDYPAAHRNLANALAAEGRQNEAIKEYQIALSLNPSPAEDIHFDLGGLFLDMNRLDEAIIQFNAATRLRPNYPDAYRSLGVAYSRKRDSANAIKAFDNALRFAPGDALAKALRDQEAGKALNSGR